MWIDMLGKTIPEPQANARLSVLHGKKRHGQTTRP
jgi:hypothetical protein